MILPVADLSERHYREPGVPIYAGRGCHLEQVARSVYSDFLNEIRLIWTTSLSRPLSEPDPGPGWAGLVA